MINIVRKGIWPIPRKARNCPVCGEYAAKHCNQGLPTCNLKYVWAGGNDTMKGFISWNGWRGEESLPVSKIITIGIKPYTYHKDGKDIKRWNVKCEIDVNNPGQKDIAWGYETEAEAREFYNYCLKQIAEWQDSGVDNE